MPSSVKRSLGYFALFACTGMEVAIVGPTLPNLAAQTSSSVGEIGLVFFLSSVGVTLGTVLGGWATERLPGRLTLGSAALLDGCLMFVIPHVPSYLLLLSVFLVKGACGGVINTGANILIGWTHGAKAGPFINALHFHFGLGAFVGPFLLGLLLTLGGAYDQAFAILGLVDLAVGAAVLLRLDAPRQALVQSDESTSGPSRQPYLLAIALAGMFFLFFYVSAEITFGGWIYTYAVNLHIADTAQAAYLTSLFWLTFTIGRLVSIPLALKVPPARTLTVALIGCAAFLALLIALSSSAIVLVVCVAGIGFCMAPMWPSGYNLTVQSIHLTARLGALIVMGDSVGGMILPGLTGLFIEGLGAQAMTNLVLASTVATALAFGSIVILRRRRQAALSGEGARSEAAA